MTPTCAGLVEPKGTGLGLLKSTFNAKNFICRLSWTICTYSTFLAQFTLEMRVTARNREKITKTSYFGSSGSFKVIDVDISKKLVASACYDTQHVNDLKRPV